MKTKKMKLYDKEHILDLKTVIALNRATNHLNRRALAVFRKHGLTMMQFAVLEALYHKGSLKVGEIIEKILTTGGNMTVVLKNLAKDGLITKRIDPEDSRAMLISITDKGSRVMERVFPEYLADLRDFLETISDSEKKNLVAVLKALRKEP